jgi:hypothetical protein
MLVVSTLVAALSATVPAAAVLPIGRTVSLEIPASPVATEASQSPVATEASRSPVATEASRSPATLPARAATTRAKAPTRPLGRYGWALLVGGFGIVGLAAHWRRRPMIVTC